MVLLTSGSYIKLHAVFQLVLAAYLTKSREVITDDEFVHGTDNGRLCIHDIFSASRSLSPLAYSGIILVFVAVFDLTFAMKLPTFNHLFAIARLVRNFAVNSPTTWSAAVRKIADFMDLYRDLCILLLMLRFSVFFAVAGSIVSSPDEFWGGAAASATAVGQIGLFIVGKDSGVGPDMNMGAGSGSAADGGTPMCDLKTKVILAYGVMEAFFSAWVIMALYDEQRATITRYQSLDDQITNFLQEEEQRP